MRKIFSLLILMFISLSANANVYSYGTSITYSPTVAYTYIAHMVVEWGEDSTSNPCLVSPTKWPVTQCEIRTTVTGTGYNTWAIDYISSPCMLSVKTLGELGSCLSGADYYASSLTVANVSLGPKTTFDFRSAHLKEDSNPCVRVVYRTTTWAGGSDPWTPLPNQVCGLVPPPVGACSTPDAIEFDHGTVTTNFNTSELVKSFNIECNMDLSAGITLTLLDNNSRLKLGDNLYSTLMINGAGVSNTNKIELKMGANSFDMTSKLSKTGEVKGGDYSGQTVMILFVD